MLPLLMVVASAVLKPQLLRIEPSGTLEYWAYCREKNLLAATISGRNTRVYRVNLGKRRVDRWFEIPVVGHALAFSPSCDLLAAGHSKETTHKASLFTLDGKEIALGTFQYPPSEAAFSADGSKLYLGNNDGTLTAFTVDGKMIFTLPPRQPMDTIMTLAISADRIIAGYYGGTIRSIKDDGAKLTESSLLLEGGGRVWKVALTPDRVIALLEKGQVLAWPLSDQAAEGSVLVEGLKDPSALAVSKDAKKLAVVGGPGAAWRFDGAKLSSGTSLGGLDRVKGFVAARGVEFVDNGQMLVGAVSSAALKLYRVR